MFSNSSPQSSGANQIMLNNVAKEKGYIVIIRWKTLRNARKSEYIAYSYLGVSNRFVTSIETDFTIIAI